MDELDVLNWLAAPQMAAKSGPDGRLREEGWAGIGWNVENDVKLRQTLFLVRRFGWFEKRANKGEIGFSMGFVGMSLWG